MALWWDSLSVLQLVFIFCAIPSSLILLIQVVITIIGIGGSDTDLDADMDSDLDADNDSFSEAAGFRFFTIQGIVAFFCIFGWTGYTLSGSSMGTTLIVLFAVVAGLLAMLAIGLMFYYVKRLQSSGNIIYSNAIGKDAEVYIPIPAQRLGSGKVMVLVQQRLVETEAVTDEEHTLRTGERVLVVGKIGNTLVVKR